MSSAPVANISIAGLLRSMKSRGYTKPGAINELIDNAIDANATKIDVRFNTETNELIIADDGDGMTKAIADKMYCIHNDKEASSKIGLYGIGKCAAEGLLSDVKSVTTTITKHANDRLWEVNADWLHSIAANEWTPRAAGASADIGAPLWDKEAINKVHGTVVRIPMQPNNMHSIIESMDTILPEIAYAFQECNDVIITVTVNGIVLSMKTEDALGWNDPALSDKQRLSTSLEVFVKDGEPTRVYHREGGVFKRFNPNPTTSTGKPIDVLQAALLDDRKEAIDSGYSLNTSLALRVVYNPKWNPPPITGEDGTRPEFIRGNVSWRRGKRHIARIPQDVPISGDHERRRILGSVRSSIDYDYRSDALIKTEGDKSRITKENIDPVLLHTVRTIIRKWSAAYYTEHVKEAEIANNQAHVPVPRDILHWFKDKWSSDAAWRETIKSEVERAKGVQIAH